MKPENTNTSSPVTKSRTVNGRMKRLVSVIVNWPRDKTDNVRRYWSPWWVIGWRLLWVAPVYTFKILFVASATCMQGWKCGKDLWDITR